MFTPETWLILSQDLIELFNGLEEEVLLELSNKLSKGADLTVDDWNKLQDKTSGAYRKQVSQIIRDNKEKINKELISTIDSALKFSENETNKVVKEVSGIDKKSKIPKNERLEIINSMQDWVNGNYEIIYKQAQVKDRELKNKISTNANKTYTIATRDTTQDLFDSIMREMTSEGIDKGFNISYANGSERSYRSYVEMSIRTRIQNVATETMQRATNRLGIIFYLSSEHSTCADDHADFQGKLYIAEKWEDYIEDEETRKQISNFIQREKILTFEYVKGPPVYLTTRPNCRHFFIPLTITQAMGDLEELKNKFNIRQGTYRKENYDDLVRQRYQERQIRKYKQRVESDKIILNNATNPTQKALIERQIVKNKALASKWNYEQYKLVNGNKNLKRVKRREQIDTLAQDLGVSIRLKK